MNQLISHDFFCDDSFMLVVFFFYTNQVFCSLSHDLFFSPHASWCFSTLLIFFTWIIFIWFIYFHMLFFFTRFIFQLIFKDYFLKSCLETFSHLRFGKKIWYVFELHFLNFWSWPTFGKSPCFVITPPMVCQVQMGH